MCQRNAGELRRGNGSADSRNGLEWDTSGAESDGLFAAATEYEGIAAFEADHPQPELRAGYEHGFDDRLWGLLAACPLSDANVPGVRREREHAGVDECVVEHELRIAETVRASDRQIIRIARTRTDDGDEP